MRWGAGTLKWVRPLHSILCLLGDETGSSVVPLTVEGIASGNTTEGHRFLSPGRFAVTGFDDYAARLKRAHVVLDSAEREAAIWQGAQNLAFAAGMEVVPDAGLLAEVAGLVEWPVPLMGTIDAQYMDLPAEVLELARQLENHAGLRAVWTGWEPDALDGRDSEYAGQKPAHDDSGRFVPYWHRDTQGISVEPLVDYDKPGAGDYYLLPKQTGNETLIEPYLYVVAGKELQITSVCDVAVWRWK
mgnify:CR=1 FL=1